MTMNEVLQVISILSFVGGSLVVVYRIGRATRSYEAGIKETKLITAQHKSMADIVTAQHKSMIDDIKDDIGKLADVITAMAVAQERMNQLQIQVNRVHEELIELKHGRGFVQERIQGEWTKT